MTDYGKRFWEAHWTGPAVERRVPVNPYLMAETADLTAGTALDAGCGAGAEAMWLAEQGWMVTAADISSAALATAQAHAAEAGLDDRIEWVEADLARWEPGRSWDLVVTNYAHADIGQIALYRRLSTWVAHGGTLLIVGHLPGDHDDDRAANDHPEAATATLEGITSLLRGPQWRIEASYESTRTVHPSDHAVHLRDVVVRAYRHP
jgi:SAM-dependent methyltransferase